MQKRATALTLAAAVAATLAACGDANQSAGPTIQPGAGVDCSYPSDGQPAKPVDPPAGKGVAATGTVTATLNLTAGDVTITMDRAKAPCTVNSFVSLAEQGYFDDTVCHRLVDYGIFVLQCGDPTATGTGGPGYVFADEGDSSMTYPRGTVAMANRGPDTNGSQFFLVWDETPLEPDYTVFGTIDEAGLDAIGGIAAQGVDAGDGMSPIAEAAITSVTLG